MATGGAMNITKMTRPTRPERRTSGLRVAERTQPIYWNMDQKPWETWMQAQPTNTA